MRATIETRLNLDYDANRVKKQFDAIIDFILYSKDEEQLSDIVNKINSDGNSEFYHFNFRFIGNYFVVRQEGFKKDIVTVEL